MDRSINYWFGILPHVFYSKKGETILLYNTQNGESIKSNSPKIIFMIEEMHQKKNLGVILLSGNEIQRIDVKNFITESIKKNICHCIPITEKNAIKPVQMMPVLNLQRDVEKISKENDRSIGEHLIHYLLKLSLQINSACEQKCKHCSTYFKQIQFCHQSSGNCILYPEQIENILAQIQYSSLQEIDITGGDVFNYPHLNDLLLLLKKYQFDATFHIHYKNCINDKFDLLNDYKKEVFITFPISKLSLEHISPILSNPKVKVIFIITTETEYEQAETMIEKYKINNPTLLPFFNGKNIDFFEKNVFLSESDILAHPIKQRIVFANQKLNTNFFGTINVLANGTVYTNHNVRAIGNINNTSVLELLQTEMTENTAWRKTRDYDPCRQCIYQYICPSPSNYEFVIGKMNLCTYDLPNRQ